MKLYLQTQFSHIRKGGLGIESLCHLYIWMFVTRCSWLIDEIIGTQNNIGLATGGSDIFLHQLTVKC